MGGQVGDCLDGGGVGADRLRSLVNTSWMCQGGLEGKRQIMCGDIELMAGQQITFQIFWKFGLLLGD
jgi:hypothetical protein